MTFKNKLEQTRGTISSDFSRETTKTSLFILAQDII